MKDCFTYPYDSGFLLKNQRKLRKELKSDGTKRIPVKIAILCGSTVNAIADQLELFLLNYGIEPEFYISEYNAFWNDVMFPPDKLTEFGADIFYIHTSTCNISQVIGVSDSKELVNDRIEDEAAFFEDLWDRIGKTFGDPIIIQNNFELPPFRLLGNADCWDIHGRVRMINELNRLFAEYAASHDRFYINDINYLSACFGLDAWSDRTAWYMYKYAMAVDAIPPFAANIAAIIKAIYGKNKKVLALDLDNTLWGGVIGEDGLDGLKIGYDLPQGQVYSDFQEYVRLHKDIGVLLTVCSKNDPENAMEGLNHPFGILEPDDFTLIKANWENKDKNISETAEELNLLTDSFVFADDNPAERAIVKDQLPGAAVPEMDGAENYIRILDRNRYFEVTSLSEEDIKRTNMYKANVQRESQRKKYADYGEYLDSLDMYADIKPFGPPYIQRISQLTNKSNQFNLTTLRCTESDIEAAANAPDKITLYGRLRDRFGDNGIVSVVYGDVESETLHIRLWLMSCRVLKREMEYAMLDCLVSEAKDRGVKKIVGYYYPTVKNAMVKELYGDFGFTKVSGNGEDTVWELETAGYQPKTKHIKINTEE